MEIAVAAARDAFSRDGGRHWSRAPGAVRANFLRAIAAKVPTLSFHNSQPYPESVRVVNI